MEGWIVEELNKVNRRTVEVRLTTHAEDDKNLSLIEVDAVTHTVRYGKPFIEKSTYEKCRVCFRNYFKNLGKTYFVVTEIHQNRIDVVTVTDKYGKY